ncbi:MAG: ABC transporter substrate-binding protein [Dehalococcoidia bacterium]
MKMNRFLAAGVALVLLLSVVLVGCSSETTPETPDPTTPEPSTPATPEPEEEWITIVDQADKVVKIPRNIERVVTIPIPFPSVFYTLAGSADMIVGMHPSSLSAVQNSILGKVAPDLLEVPTDAISSTFEVNVEELLKLEPDVVIQWAWMTDEIAEMEAVGIPVISVDYGTQEDLEGWIRIIGQMLGKEDKAARLLAYQHDTLEDVLAISNTIPAEDKPTCFYFYDATIKTSAGGTYQDVWIEATGGTNVAGVIDSPLGTYNVTVGMEQVLEWNPEILYVSNFMSLEPEDFYNNTIEGQDWSSIDAVQNGRVYKVPLGIYRWDAPNAESPLMMKWAAMTQNSEFYNYDLEQDMKDFYSEFFNYNLSDTEIDEILNK